MLVRTGLATLAVLSLAVAAAGPAAGATTNRLANAGAEDGLSGWEADGFLPASYGSSSTVPTPETVASDSATRDSGRMLFQATAANGTLRQVVSVDDLAATIDAGSESLAFGGLLGAAAGSGDGARVSAQPVDAAGGDIGPPATVGPPSAGDRANQTRAVVCLDRVALPVGTRSVRLTLATAGIEPATAFADGLVLTEHNVVPPQAGGPADGPGCGRWFPLASPPPAPTPAPVATGDDHRPGFPSVRSAAARRVDRRTRRTRVATVACPVGPCRVAVARVVRVRVAGRRFRIRVDGPRRVHSRRTAEFVARFPRAALRRLDRRGTTVRLMIRVSSPVGPTRRAIRLTVR